MKNSSPRRLVSFVLSTALVLVLTSISAAQQERPNKLSDENANNALQDFKTQSRIQGEKRVARGGGWRDDAYGSRVAYRIPLWPNHRSAMTGFRVVRVVTQ